MHKVEWPVKSSFAVHVLTVLPLLHDVNFSDVVAFNLLPLGRVEPAESHDLHHVDFFLALSLEVFIGEGERGSIVRHPHCRFLLFAQFFAFLVPSFSFAR